MRKLHVAVAAASVAVAMSASAAIVNFDDLATGFLPASYQGFSWSGWGVDDQANYQSSYGNTYAVPSPNNFAYNGFGVMTVTTTGGGLFNFIGADVSTFADQNQFVSFSSTTLTVEGYNGATLVGSVTWNLSRTSFQTELANFTGIDSLVFKNDGVDGRWWTLDNFNYSAYSAVPEPSTYIAGALLLLPFGAQGIRYLRNRKA